MKPTLLVTGGAGFIGSALVRMLNAQKKYRIVNIDKLTYAGSLDSVSNLASEHVFVQTDICNEAEVLQILNKYAPVGIIHLAAESHVDNSIASPMEFIQTNIVGTFALLEACRKYLANNPNLKSSFRFHHVSTDEVFGSLGPTGAFSEDSKYEPNSPYSASKASSDHLVRAWHHTFGMNVVTTNCSNNFGPFQFPEKLIPVTILRAVNKLNIPIYGKGANMRDWLFVDDHADALIRVFEHGKTGEVYNIGCSNDITNLEVVSSICKLLNQKVSNTPENSKPPEHGKPFEHESLMSFVTDRAGHDFRYAINAQKLIQELNWKPAKNFQERLSETVDWYLQNKQWCYERTKDSVLLAKLKNSHYSV
jgi:dTDP-glucose 4,6-dehydratase